MLVAAWMLLFSSSHLSKPAAATVAQLSQNKCLLQNPTDLPAEHAADGGVDGVMAPGQLDAAEYPDSKVRLKVFEWTTAGVK